MCLFIDGNEFVETICVEHGRVYNLSYHNERMNRTRRVFWGENVEVLQLEDYIHPQQYEKRTRCRVVYGKSIVKVEYFMYHIREVNSLKLVHCDEAIYSYKSTDRSLLNALYEKREDNDDVLIVRNGLLTDTSIANIALFDGVNWYTPVHPLLKGTRRQSLLDERILFERDINISEIGNYQKIALFNAMIPFRTIELDIEAINR